MRFICCGSSSKGNGYILDNDSEALVIEAGLPLSEVSTALGYRTSTIKGLVVTHRHGDHAKYIQEYINAGIPVYCHEDVMTESKVSQVYNLQHKQVVAVGGFSIIPLDVKHDVPCFAFLIKHKDLGVMLFATDTPYLGYNFKGVTKVAIETNYCGSIIEDNIRSNKIDSKHADRVILNHMSLETAVEYLAKDEFKYITDVFLLHLSHDNADGVRFKAEVEKVQNKRVFVAKKGLSVELHPYTTF